MIKVKEVESHMSTTEKKVPLILLADDDIEIRTLVRHALEDLSCDLIEAEDGEAALEQILVEAPDLVVLDVMMPGLTGWEICKYIRQRENYDHTLILMLTAVGEEVNSLTAPLYGADHHLDKPFDLDEMQMIVKKLLAQGKSHKGQAQFK
jgi:DNA-binding response OmpR family regulator